MNDESATVGNCPSPQLISELVDGHERAEVIAHLEHCGDCRRIEEAYRRINEATAAGVRSGGDLNERIKAACARQVPVRQTPEPLLWYHSPFVRLAAAMAVSASLIVLLGFALGRSGDATQTAGNQELGPDAPGDTPVVATRGLGDVLTDPGIEGDVDALEVRKVTVQDGGSGDAHSVENRARTLLPLPGKVRHVWAVRDVASSEKYLESILEDTHYTTSFLEPGRLAFSIDLRDIEVQKLVNDLAEREWSLVSSDRPQPAEDNELRFLGRRVTYNLELVGVKNPK